MTTVIVEEIRRRAENRCEYCHAPNDVSELRHAIDHVVSRRHGGRSELQNLALCCPQCNRFKGPNIAGVDPDGGALTRLFHPRRDIWSENFKWIDQILLGTTPIGRTTVAVLKINLPLRVASRRSLQDEGFSFT